MRQLMMGCVAAGASEFGLADFTYTGTYTWVQDTLTNWRLKFLTSGIFTPRKSVSIDAFLLGGGAGGGNSNGGNATPGGGGAGGRTGQLFSSALDAGVSYVITIGAGGPNHAGGGNTSFVGGSLNGAVAGGSAIVSGQEYRGTNGGSGGGSATSGAGGADGNDGASGDKAAGGTGQHTSTREFGEAGATLYGGGGGGGGGQYSYIANGGSAGATA